MVVIKTNSGKMVITKMNNETRSTRNRIKQGGDDEQDDNSMDQIKNQLPPCWLCCERPIDCALLECGHMVSCWNCIHNLHIIRHKCKFFVFKNLVEIKFI